MTYSMHRPEGYEGHGDRHLQETARQLRQKLSDMQRHFSHDSLRLDSNGLSELAGILVDFGEDLANGTGIWEAYERYNTEFFGTALPLISGENGGNPSTAFHPGRFQHFLWVLYPTLIDGLTLSPTHQDILRIAKACSAFLSDEFSAIPKGSGVKAFLGTPNDHGWDVKRKLIWLGSHSYMFRVFYARYMAEHTRADQIVAYTDDFICQECTHWSGLGAIDILAGVLDISEHDRRDLRSWYERHAACYRLDSVNEETLQAVNLINNQSYSIRMNMKHPFKRGQFVFSSLTPWRGEWYWSGQQHVYGDASNVDVDDLVRKMKRQSPGIVCRYSKEYEAQVRERAAELHKQAMAFYGKDLMVYPDGLSMAADWQKEIRQQWESKPEQEVKDVIDRHQLEKGRPDMKIPDDLLRAKGGVGVFLNPEEGKEVMTHFTSLIAGLAKKGKSLTENEAGAIYDFFDADAISPNFVRRVLEEYGDESIKTVFLLKDNPPDYWLNYILRSRKGHFYRKRYPSLSVI